ncbi:MAG: TlyA family RNA methyltransferase, partial [Oscillospiraceae bacterium]|nr:TlyA family RNA methyltransferase [Oscillospiraceae bacterium]
MKEKQRLDVLLTECGLVESRAKAQALIMAGEVYVDQQKVDKCGTAIPVEA